MKRSMDLPVLRLLNLLKTFVLFTLAAILQKAFLEGTKSTGVADEAIADLPAQQREHDHTDTFIHEFCKLFGRHGVSEYGCGNSTFPDFLALKLSDACAAKDGKYYESCAQVLLE